MLFRFQFIRACLVLASSSLFILLSQSVLGESSSSVSTAATTTNNPNDVDFNFDFDRMLDQIRSSKSGFIAALDQSGGSTQKALKMFGFPTSKFEDGDKSMYDAIHEMRSRIVTNPSFRNSNFQDNDDDNDSGGGGVIGAILFEDTMKRQIIDNENGKDDDMNTHYYNTAEYLWKKKHIVPFLKIDKGLESLSYDGSVQLMKPIPNLLTTCLEAKSKYGIFGTKMRSVIKRYSKEGIRAIVNQQFDTAREILDAGLIPIIEPEIDIDCEAKEECEIWLKECLLEGLHSRLTNDKDCVILKLSLPSSGPNFYQDCIDHPRCLRLVALSGGHTQEEAIDILKQQNGMIASFSRALTEGLSYQMTDEEFTTCLKNSIHQISKASSSSSSSSMETKTM